MPSTLCHGWASEVLRGSLSRLYIGDHAGELQQSISRLVNDPSRQQALQQWLDEQLRARFETRILAIDKEAALTWGQLSGEAMARGNPVRLFNPWTIQV